MVDLNSLISNLSNDSVFEEIPVDLDTFMGPGYLEQTGVSLSQLQKDIINHSTQIFDLKTLIKEYGDREGRRIHRYTKKEIISMLGKGSGKDYCAEISCAYLVYKLLCLKDPAQYFGKPPDDAIDIVNVAVNADQAQRVFFKGFTNMIKRSPWFADKVVAPKQRVYEFNKSISVHSGHSEMEAFEGLNTIMVILDEISGFASEVAQSSTSDVSPAQATYNMYKASLTSRFPDVGKLVLLSFPRSKNCFISQAYREAIVTKDTIHKSETLPINPEMPIDTPGNSITIEWTEDDILDYKLPGVWALRKPSWVVNPTKRIENYISDFLRNYKDSLGRFAAEPTDGAFGFFPDFETIKEATSRRNGVDPETGVFEPWFKPRPDREYFMHVDLARKHDRAVVALAHVDTWKYQEIVKGQFENTPYVEVDAYMYWTPTKETQIDFTDVKNFILGVRKRGFDIQLVTFDQWESSAMIDYLNKIGVRAEMMSVGLMQYNDLKLMMIESRVNIPEGDIIRRELQQLKLTKNMKNVDHPNTQDGSKDISDAVAGAVYNAATRAHSDFDDEIETVTLDQVNAKMAEANRVARRDPGKLIDPPKRPSEDEWAVHLL